MKKLTVEDILKLRPCYEYKKDKIEKLWGDNESLTLLEILDLNIPIHDRIWCILQKGVIDEKNRRLIACDLAQHVLPIFEKKYPDEKRPRIAIATSRKFANGEATEEERFAAAAAATYIAVVDAHAAYAAAATYAAAAYAETTYAAAAAAYAAAARKKEREWQLEYLKKFLQK